MVSNALVTIDTGLAFVFGLHVLVIDSLLLHFPAHGFEIVAVTAFARTGLLHAFPFACCQFHPVRFEFFLGIDIARELAPNFLARLDLAQYLVPPVPGHVTVGTDSAHTGTVRIVYGLLVFLVYVIAHFMAANTELQLVRRFHPGIEPAPEDEAGEKGYSGNADQGIFRARPLQE